MFAKVFAQIFDSSIADDYRLRHFFMDLLVLADPNGCVDMTPTAIAARTRMPLEDVTAMLKKLEQPDPESRTPDAGGRRIERLDEHRTWGWHIINYSHFRQIASEQQRREKTLARVIRFNQKRQQNVGINAPLTQVNAINAMQKQKQRETEKKPSDHLLNSELKGATKRNRAKAKPTTTPDGATVAMFEGAQTQTDLPPEVAAILAGPLK